ncbi:MAG: phosphoribosylformylglycinamidine synthase [Dysgonamonadaceae bacterium]|jgi:phosphoribosylformylglycinamidine synthase|nr:phosphoribosylformylglycinamidine synthase [Dysgonamonadaceae bacterium]
MILFFKSGTDSIIVVETSVKPSKIDCKKLIWLFGEAELLPKKNIDSFLVGPRREMVTPWSTNAVEITQNMGIEGISRIEEFWVVPDKNAGYDPMLQRLYTGIGQDVFTINKKPEAIVCVDDIAVYNQQEGLALSPEEIDYLNRVGEKLGRKLTDSEVFGFSQVNSEHCRHKIFNGIFIIDGVEKESTLFNLIRKTAQANPNQLISAYKDNVAFNAGPVIEQFAPQSADKPDYFSVKNIETVLSLKAETHNFPTTVEPFNGASTGTGGEIRDRLGGGKASLPIAGTAVYMTSYPRTEEDREWENAMPARKWLYQTPAQILIKASNGASDFGNKFGQPLICGSLLTFEHEENRKKFAYDKVIMLAGGVGFANKRDALKGEPQTGEKVVVFGGDNYRIGMGGGAVSSVATGEYNSGIELNAVQRANPEMQKRVSNVIRALAESDDNPIVSIHDHGAGGHLNCLSELVESTGGKIDMSKLPVGDPTLSAKEIIGNESQERMGLLLKKEDIDRVRKIAERERAPMYVAGETTGDDRLVFEQADGQRPLDMHLADFFGKPPRTVMNDLTIEEHFKPIHYDLKNLNKYVENVLQLESVACKDWLTNKVDRSVTGKIARQQCQGEIQLPLSDLGAVALDYRGESGIATSIGHAPQAALINPSAGSVLSIAEALTNIVFAPLKGKIESISLSANWMWPCKNPGENARLYEAVEACSNFACDLGINIPTGKDSLSMTQKYGEEKVFSPGTVIISAGAEVSDIRKIVSPVLVNNQRSVLYYIDFSFNTFKLGGSAFAQSLNRLGDEVPTVTDAEYFRMTFDTIQELIDKKLILAGHDISAGGMIVTLLEMTFGNTKGGLDINLDKLKEKDLIKILFSENPGIVIQVEDRQTVENILNDNGIGFARIGRPTTERQIRVSKDEAGYQFDIDYMRDIWYYSSYLLDCLQSGEKCAKERFINYKQQPLQIKFHKEFTGTLSEYGLSFNRRPSGIKAAIVREKGTNGDREMAYALYLAGFDVKDVHTTDLVSGRETLEDINMLVFCGGFANSDVLGSAKGWAGSLLYNEKAKETLDKFYARPDTLSLGICNGCQLMIALNLIIPKHKVQPRMLHNDSHKFESEFISLTIPKNKSIMLGSLAGSKLGVWVAHGEGKFSLPLDEKKYSIVAKYVYNTYPGNPNGSDYGTAGICSKDGRHLAMMPHPERAIFPWQCAYYPAGRRNDEITPWIEAFVNARKWIEQKD